LILQAFFKNDVGQCRVKPKISIEGFFQKNCPIESLVQTLHCLTYPPPLMRKTGGKTPTVGLTFPPQGQKVFTGGNGEPERLAL